MHPFNSVEHAESFECRQSAAKVLASLLKQHMGAFLPQQAALAACPQRAHYDEGAQNLEGVARMLWGAVPLAADEPELLVSLRDAVVNGVDPEHPAYWGTPTDFNQRCVEMSAVAFAIVEQETLFFRELPELTKRHLVKWLQSATYIQIPNNNWHFFRILILMALRHIGAVFDADVLKRDLREIDSMYLGEGWYRDGRSGCTDYYNPFAFHYYGLVFARWVNLVADFHTPWLIENGQLFIHRAALFAKSFSVWTDQDGASIAYGRSMTYRFAGAGVWSELACYSTSLSNVGLSVADMKTLWTKTLAWWGTQPIISDGLLSIGYRYPNLIASEIYNSPMSPLLTLKGFAALRLAENHPFWQAETNNCLQQDDLICLEKNRQITVRHQGASYLLSGAPSAAELRNSHDKYLKFAYSSAHGFGVEAVRWIEQGFIGDNVMACQHPMSGEWHFRREFLSSELVDGRLITMWQPFADVSVTTTQWFEDGREWREHRIESQTAFEFILSGYAVDAWVKCIGTPAEMETALIHGSQYVSGLKLVSGEGKHSVMPCAPNTNLLFAQAAVPVIFGTVPAGNHTLKVEVISERI